MHIRKFKENSWGKYKGNTACAICCEIVLITKESHFMTLGLAESHGHFWPKSCKLITCGYEWGIHLLVWDSPEVSYFWQGNSQYPISNIQSGYYTDPGLQVTMMSMTVEQFALNQCEKKRKEKKQGISSIRRHWDLGIACYHSITWFVLVNTFTFSSLSASRPCSVPSIVLEWQQF